MTASAAVSLSADLSLNPAAVHNTLQAYLRDAVTGHDDVWRFAEVHQIHKHLTTVTLVNRTRSVWHDDLVPRCQS
jgi:hypothetical protein